MKTFVHRKEKFFVLSISARQQPYFIYSLGLEERVNKADVSDVRRIEGSPIKSYVSHFIKDIK
jgi:hypothetical protein